MDDYISRKAAVEVIDAVFPVDPTKSEYAQGIACGAALAKRYVEQLPSAEPVIRCKDCFYGYLYSGVYAGTTCSWVECKNPDGLNRDVSIDGYCSAAIRRKDNE